MKGELYIIEKRREPHLITRNPISLQERACNETTYSKVFQFI